MTVADYEGTDAAEIIRKWKDGKEFRLHGTGQVVTRIDAEAMNSKLITIKFCEGEEELVLRYKHGDWVE
jgi:hypothetical protein